MARELRDITANHQGELDLAYLQRKLAAAGEMKTAIKRLLELWSDHDTHAFGSAEGRGERMLVRKRMKELRKAMEAYLNV